MGWIEWVFSGVGVTVATWLGKKILGKNESQTEKSNTNTNTNTITVVNNLAKQNEELDSATSKEAELSEADQLERIKPLTRILFIDDDTKFKVVNILKKAGWVNTKAIKDATSTDLVEIREANILFVDIQGVGKFLDCKDEGLGLAMILIKKYPEKKVIIYSAQSSGNMFHEALKMAHDTLPKNAQPYEFQQLVEQFALEIFANKR